MTAVRTRHRAPSTPSSSGRLILDLRSHRNLRGPYTAGGELLRRVVPELVAVDPELVRPAATAVVAIAPDLEGRAPTRPQTLTDLAEGDERTRFYAVQRTRDLAFMVSELVNAWARTCHPGGVTLRFHELADADVTDRQLFDTLARRGGRAGLTVVDAGQRPTTFPGVDPAQAYIDADGTTEDQRAAYDDLPLAERRARHTRRAHVLVEQADPGTSLGAIPYHLELGENPAEAIPWLVAGQNQAFREGFYEAALDLGRRGRALIAWSDDPGTYNYLTKRVIGALTYLGFCDEAIALIDEHRQITTEVADQMNGAYMMAMIYTRHLPKERINQDLALAWVNTALAIAAGASGVERHAFYGAFMRNAKALVELHRGNLTGSMDLVDQAIAIADENLDDDKHQLHRTVLINNRARLLLAMNDHAGAIAAFDAVLARDPEYDEPYFDRSVAHRARGDLDAAIRDLDRATELSVAFTDAYYNRADVLLELGEDERALTDLDTVLDIDPNFVEALLNRGALHLEAGRVDAAAVDIEHGLSADRGRADLWSALGLVRSEQERYDEALGCYANALEIDPLLVEAYGNRAILHFGAGRSAEALADLDQAVDLTDTATLRMNRALARYACGDPAGAIEDIDVALADPGTDLAEALYRRGLAHHALGQDVNAGSDWQRHLELVTAGGDVGKHRDEIEALAPGITEIGSNRDQQPQPQPQPSVWS